MENFYGNWKLEMFLPVSPIAAVEVSQNQLGIQPFTEKNFIEQYFFGGNIYFLGGNIYFFGGNIYIFWGKYI